MINGEGVMTETENETAGALNSYYHSVFTRDDDTSAPPAFPERTQESITGIFLTTEMVKDRLLELNPNKAAGLDQMESWLLKECAEEIAPTLHKIYRKSLDEAEVPMPWKKCQYTRLAEKL